jgi:hypothetical protein
LGRRAPAAMHAILPRSGLRNVTIRLVSLKSTARITTTSDRSCDTGNSRTRGVAPACASNDSARYTAQPQCLHGEAD